MLVNIIVSLVLNNLFKIFNPIEKTDRMSSNVQSSQTSVTTFNRLKQSVLYLVIKYSEKPEVADTEI
jgi:hypothetical protein